MKSTKKSDYAIILIFSLAITWQSALAQSIPTSFESELRQRAPEDYQSTPLTITSLGDKIYLLAGDGGNVVAISDGSTVLLVDSGIGCRTSELYHAVYKATQRPITTLINTDWHSDHAGGNAFFSAFGVTIVAHVNTKERLVSQRGRGIPDVVFDDNMTLNIGDEELHLYHYGPGHTDGDTVIFLEKANIAILGDAVSAHGYPWIDLDSGGSLAGIITTLDHVLAAGNEETRIIPGHGPILYRSDLEAYRDMLVMVQARIQSLISSGESIGRVITAAPTSEFDSQWSHGHVSAEVFTISAYKSITTVR